MPRWRRSPRRTAALVTAAPTFELPANLAQHLGHPVVEVPVTDGARARSRPDGRARRRRGFALRLQSEQPDGDTARRRRDRGSSSTTVLKREPKATILIDEAYHEYVERADYRTAIPLALANPG